MNTVLSPFVGLLRTSLFQFKMVESRDDVPATPQNVNGEQPNWADLVDLEENKKGGTASVPAPVVPSLKPSEQNVQIEYNSDGDKVEIEYRINPDTNKKEKVTFIDKYIEMGLRCRSQAGLEDPANFSNDSDIIVCFFEL